MLLYGKSVYQLLNLVLTILIFIYEYPISNFMEEHRVKIILFLSNDHMYYRITVQV